MRAVRVFTILLGLSALCAAQQGWWMREPIRWVQTNLRETDAALDPQRFLGEIAGFDANVLLMAMGGISSFYPTQVQFHYQSPYIPKGHDTFGEVLRLAHARGIRVVGRFDLSKARKDVYDAHPEWFFKKANGEPAPYNGLYQACINGGWYREKAVEILTEALERYDVDGLFFNMFSNPSSDYSGNPLGLCQCGNCKRLFRARFGRELPTRPDADYQAFLAGATRTMSETIRKLIKSKRPNAMLVGTSAEITDGVFSESNTAVRRPLPLWPYASSYNVNRARNSFPEKMAINQCMSFIDFPWRFATVPQAEIRIRLWQNVAHGGAAALNMHGTMEQEDRLALEAARPIYRQLLERKDYYAGQQSAARVILLGRTRGSRASDNALRGLFRFLSEEHIPFGMTDNLDWLGKRDAGLVVAVGEVPQELEPWVRQGGRLLAATPAAAPFGIARPVKQWKDTQAAYFRIRDHALFPSLKRVNVTFLYGDFLEVEGKSPLTFIPPSLFGPPEFVHVDWKDTDAPGLILRDHGLGKIAWLPWDIGALYYQHSSQAHAGLLRDLADHLLAGGRQLKTNAHPLVEMVLMRQKDRHLLHLINLSGHSQTAYFDAIPMQGIRVQVAGTFRSARLVATGRELALSRAGAYAEFTVPALAQYELVELR
ncbi:MAG: hypothetical protein HY822_22140 [Acidobacteria bacterium]|nr:hypothetical protein [Acidobacteriota bacterium]